MLNVVREISRFFINQGGYYLTVAEFPGSQHVNRDAALLLVVPLHVAFAVLFRLELSSFQSEAWTFFTFTAQAVLEVVARLTAAERDAWTKRWARRLCLGRGGRRSTRLVVAATSASFAPSALAKHSTERLAKADEGRTVVAEYVSRAILVEMISEYAGTSLCSVGLWTAHCLL